MFDFDNSCLLATAAAVPAVIAIFVGGVVVVLFCKQISDYDENKFWFIVLPRSTSSTRIKIPCSVVSFKIDARGNFAWRVCTSGCFLDSLANRNSLRSIFGNQLFICSLRSLGTSKLLPPQLEAPSVKSTRRNCIETGIDQWATRTRDGVGVRLGLTQYII